VPTGKRRNGEPASYQDNSNAVAYQEGQVRPRAADLAQWTVDKKDFPSLASGLCPSCNHRTEFQLSYRALGAGASMPSTPSAVERRSFKMTCACGQSHPDAASPGVSHASCGRWWFASVTLQDRTGEPRVFPADDETLVPAMTAWAEVAKSEETAFRTLAEKWTNGVTVILGLFGLAGFVTSKDAFTGLPFCAKVAAAALIIVALGFGVGAVYRSYSAAYGRPTVIDGADDAKLRQWYDGAPARLEASVKAFQSALRLAFAALAFLVAAAGLMWLVPRHTDKPTPLLCRITATATGPHNLTYDINANTNCAATNDHH
jgi:hypothetical protein